MHACVLHTTKLDKIRTAENEKVPCTTTYTKRESLTAITMDNATNQASEVERHQDIVNILHVAHSINMEVRKGFGVGATETPLRLKVAATHFNKSTTVSNLLKENQKLLGLKKKLINDELEQYILLDLLGIEAVSSCVCRYLEEETVLDETDHMWMIPLGKCERWMKMQWDVKIGKMVVALIIKYSNMIRWKNAIFA